jgi:hypothetical protein
MGPFGAQRGLRDRARVMRLVDMVGVVRVLIAVV